MKKVFFVIAIILFVPMLALAQQKDSLIVKDSTGKIVASKKVRRGFLHTNMWRDSAGNRTFEPRKASIYSAILPGLGQVYNRKYWKVPLVYAAVGIPIYTFFYNKQWYKRTQYALAVSTGSRSGTDWEDSLSAVHPSLVPLVRDNQSNSIANYRNEFRKNMDYSILFTLLFWGLNVVDATVDAHLKGFNVNDNLSMQIKPVILSNQIGVSLVFKITDNHSKAIP